MTAFPCHTCKHGIVLQTKSELTANSLRLTQKRGWEAESSSRGRTEKKSQLVCQAMLACYMRGWSQPVTPTLLTKCCLQGDPLEITVPLRLTPGSFSLAFACLAAHAVQETLRGCGYGSKGPTRWSGSCVASRSGGTIECAKEEKVLWTLK